MNPLNVHRFLQTNRSFDVGIWLSFCIFGFMLTACNSAPDPRIAFLKSAEPNVRRSGAEELGHSKDPHVVELLIAALQDTDSGVRQSAAGSLSKIGDTRAVEPLIAAMKDSDPDVRRSAVSALGGIKDHRAVDALVTTLKDTNSGLQVDAAYSLGSVGDPRAVEPLIAALMDPNYEFLQLAAADALGRIKDPRAVEPLIATLKHPALQWEAPRALGQIGGTAVDPLIAALKSTDSRVRRGAARALGQIEDPRAVSVLVTALREHDTDVIAGAVSFFIRRGESSSEDILIETLKKSGDALMAEDLLNCGNAKLEQAAREWKRSDSNGSNNATAIVEQERSGNQNLTIVGQERWGGKQ